MAEGQAGAALEAAGAEVEDFLAREVKSSSPQLLRLFTVPAPAAPLERLWQAWPQGTGVLWDPPAGAGLAGVGTALEVRAEGEGRFATVDAFLAEVGAKSSSRAWPGLAAVEPSFVGGFAFVPAGASAPPWESFGDAWWVLPRWCYRCDGSAAQLTLALSAGEVAEVEEVVQEYRRLCRELLGKGAQPAPLTGLFHREEPGASDWRQRVEQAQARIRVGELAKVVLARQVVVTAPAPLAPEGLLARVGQHEPGLYRFGLRTSRAALVGASPELLVARAGQRVTSEALAGSVRRGSGELPPDTLPRLLADPKEMEEHRLVVEAIRAALAPLCSQLEYPRQPQLRVLRHLAHLATPFTGLLRTPARVLALAARLHPTPAVAGVPLPAALDLIGALEDAPRGWFAGCVGAVGAGGDGELAVALRCAVVVGPQAQVWAGAGIVGASRPAAEVEETAAKAAAALAALGLAP